MLTLTKGYFDLEKKTLTISKSFQRLKGKNYITSPKTEKSNRVIQKAINWEHFLKIMEEYGYEIKFWKHIAFKQKNQQRFTRAKTIGTNYIEEKIRNKDKEIGELVDKTKYRNQDWVVHNNMQVASKILLKIRDKGFNSMEALEKGIKKISFRKINWNKNLINFRGNKRG